MLDALKQLVGLAPRDRREVWHEKPLVIVDDEGAMIFSGTATIEYTPSDESYEKGHAEIYDEADGEHVLSVDIVSQRLYSGLNQRDPFRQRWMRTGLTAKGIDSEGRAGTLYVGRHAQAFMLRGRPLDDGTADLIEAFPDVGEEPPPL